MASLLHRAIKPDGPMAIFEPARSTGHGTSHGDAGKDHRKGPARKGRGRKGALPGLTARVSEGEEHKPNHHATY